MTCRRYGRGMERTAGSMPRAEHKQHDVTVNQNLNIPKVWSLESRSIERREQVVLNSNRLMSNAESGMPGLNESYGHVTAQRLRDLYI
jgi:hypothetical protein